LKHVFEVQLDRLVT